MTPAEQFRDRMHRLDDLTKRHNRAVTEHNSLIARSDTLTAGEQTRVDDLTRAMAKLADEADAIRAEVDSMIDGDLSALGIAVDTPITDDERSPEQRRRSRPRRSINRAAWQTEPTRLAPHEAIQRAHSALDATHDRGLDRVPDDAFDKVERMLASAVSSEAARTAAWTLAASNPHYESAFAKLVLDPVRGHLEWDADEQRAYSVAANVSRAMSLTNANGGYMVPFTLDPAILLTSDGSNNPLRRLASIKQTTTDTWNGVTSAGATAEWKAEAAEVADGSPTLAQPTITTHFGDSFVPYSFEYGMDAADALDELTSVLVDAADNLMATGYTTGTGSGQPEGIVTGLVGTASEIDGGGTEAIIAADAYTLQNALPARFSANATWQSHIATANTFRQFETTNGALAFPELRDTTPRLIGKRWFENSNMDSTIDDTATANNYVLIYGDVRAGFFIVDRIGTTLELIPNLVGSNQRPTGQRGALLWFRTGSKVVVPQALRILDIPTTA